MRSRLRRLLPRLGLTSFGCLLALTIAEVAVRAHVRGAETRTLEDWQKMAEGSTHPIQGEARLGELIRASEHPRIVYEFIPNISGVRYLGCPLTTDRFGFRGPELSPELSPEPEDGTLRIVGLGDSVMFGWGVRDEECYLRVLESRLNAVPGGPRVEVINTAVPGYNTAMEVATLEAKVLPLRPDLVIVGFIGNDHSLPNLIPAEPDDYLTLRRSFLWEALGVLLRGRRMRPMDLVDAPRAEDGEAHFEHDPDRVPERFRDMVGAGGIRRALARLKELAEQHEFKVLVFAQYDTPAYLTQTCDDLGLPLLSHRAAADRYMQEHGIEQSLGSELTLSDRDSHPSALQHRMLGEALHQYLRDHDMLR